MIFGCCKSKGRVPEGGDSGEKNEIAVTLNFNSHAVLTYKDTPFTKKVYIVF